MRVLANGETILNKPIVFSALEDKEFILPSETTPQGLDALSTKRDKSIHDTEKAKKKLLLALKRFKRLVIASCKHVGNAAKYEKQHKNVETLKDTHKQARLEEKKAARARKIALARAQAGEN